MYDSAIPVLGSSSARGVHAQMGHEFAGRASLRVSADDAKAFASLVELDDTGVAEQVQLHQAHVAPGVGEQEMVTAQLRDRRLEWSPGTIPSKIFLNLSWTQMNAQVSGVALRPALEPEIVGRPDDRGL